MYTQSMTTSLAHLNRVPLFSILMSLLLNQSDSKGGRSVKANPNIAENANQSASEIERSGQFTDAKVHR
jgi:hypothetical protein